MFQGDEDGTEDALREIFEGYETAPTPIPHAKPREFHSEWLYEEIDNVYVRSLWPDRQLHEQPHDELCGIIEQAIGDCSFSTGGKKFVMIGVPRGANKTTLAAEMTPCVVLSRNPNARVLISSFRYDVSQKRLAAARQHFETNPEFHRRYGGAKEWVPQFRERPWSNEQMVVMKRTAPLIDASITAAGTDRSMTGGHFDLIIADDLVNDLNSRTKDQRDKVTDYIQDLYPILEPNGVLIMIFTRWHTDDAYGRIIRLDDARERRKETPFWKKVIRGCFDGPEGLYYPAKWDHKALEDEKERLTARKFAAQYLLQPIADEDKTFAMDRARVVNFTFEPRQFGGVVTVSKWANERLPVSTTGFWDPAGPKKGGKRADSHGLTVTGMDPMRRLWVQEAEEVKTTAVEIVDRWCKLIVYYHISVMGIEDTGMQTLWLELLKAELTNRGIAPPTFVELSTGNVPKEMRIELVLQPLWDRGSIILKPEQHLLFDQIDGFSPAGEEHEDVLDSLAGNASIARPASPDFIHVRDENPVDPEWLRRRDRIRTEEEEKYRETSGGGTGGMHGPMWKVG